MFLSGKPGSGKTAVLLKCAGVKDTSPVVSCFFPAFVKVVSVVYIFIYCLCFSLLFPCCLDSCAVDVAQDMKVLFICPTGALVFAIQSLLPSQEENSNISVDTLHGALAYTRAKDQKNWSPPSFLRQYHFSSIHPSFLSCLPLVSVPDLTILFEFRWFPCCTLIGLDFLSVGVCFFVVLVRSFHLRRGLPVRRH